MRHFLVRSLKGRTSPDYDLNDLPGSAGRLDIVSRSANAALWLSNGMRRDTVFHALLLGPPDAPKHVRLEGERLRKVAPDERNISIFIRKALERGVPGKEIETTPGIFCSKKGLEEILSEHRDCELYLLDEKGKDIKEVRFGKDCFFILGDKEDLTEEERAVCEKMGAKKVSLGEKSYLSSHCIVMLNWWLDRVAGAENESRGKKK